MEQIIKLPMKIPTSELWPTEGVVCEERVKELTESLDAGKELCPVEYLELGGRKLVRNGNHRVRAWIEYHRKKGVLTPDIPAIPSKRNGPPSDWQGPAIAEALGNGEKAFDLLNKVPRAEYGQAQKDFVCGLRSRNSIRAGD
jgi:hypothetical protein